MGKRDTELQDEDDLDEKEPVSKPSKKRDKSNNRPEVKINWEAVENDYVWGDTIKKNADGTYERKYPTLRELGEKHGVNHRLIHYYAKKQKWMDRRLAAISKTKEEFDIEVAKSRARGTVDALGALDKWVQKFCENVDNNKVPADSIADLDKVARLQKFLRGEAESRSEQKLVVSLETLQARHRTLRGKVVEADGAVAGELGDEDVITGELPEDATATGA